MGGGEINVAYEGTFGDLGPADDVPLFGVSDNTFDFTRMGPPEGFTAVNAGHPHRGTVSPKDVFNNSTTTDSVPPSTTFTNLTTPGSTILETPDDEYHTSPLFPDSFGSSDNHTGDQWFSLFPDDNMVHSGASDMIRTTSATSANFMVHPGGEGNARKRSSTGATPSPATFKSPAVKHSDVNGINKLGKRDKPLPPIMVDENDTVALKRARNTAAARKSRAKKVQEHDELTTRINDLEAEVEHWKAIALGHAAVHDTTE